MIAVREENIGNEYKVGGILQHLVDEINYL
jgi:hypothetical protein